MKSFLQQVAEYYATGQGLEDYCFVFPNRRSGKFFEQRLGEAINGPAMMPRIVTMTDFLSDVTGYIQVSPVEAMMVLYKAYVQVMGNEAAPIDTFVFWGNLIINDFNDADMNLVDMRQLYSNLSDLRKISTDYLDSDLRQAIERVLNVRIPMENSDRFWREPWQGMADDGEVRRSFFSLWERLYDIYCTYHQMLREQGLSTIGMVYRDAAQRLLLLDERHLPRKVVMVGFSSLSVSEMAVFKALKQMGLGQFWWDDALDVTSLSELSVAIGMVGEYARMFPAPTALEPVTLRGKCVEAVAVPSSVGQAKWASHRIDLLKRQGFIPHPEDAVNTAVVLPDERLFIPLLNSLSGEIAHFNVTMGYPLRHANIVSLMHLVARAHKQAVRHGDEWTFYREDVKDIMSHPIIKSMYTREAMTVTNHIAEHNVWNVSAAWLCKLRGFDTLFSPLQDVADVQQVLQYIDRLMAFCHEVDAQVRRADVSRKPSVDDDEHDDDASIRELLPLQSAFIEQYVEALEQLKLAIAAHGLPVADDTLFYLIDRLIQSYVVPFEGEPLKGLQIMGVQETRSLDFENLVILSMNERVMPRKHGIASLIPDDLRAAFYMLTGSRQEAIATYDFYRLISRASRVVLVYSTASTGVGAAEPSRFIGQLKLLFGDEIVFREMKVDTAGVTPAEIPICVPKASTPMPDYVTPSVMADPVRAKCLSHSSIAEYMDCPLKFYLHHVEHLTDTSDENDFMDYGTFGNIIHDTLQALYYPPMPGGERREGVFVVTEQMIEQFKQERMRREVERHINEQYLHHEATEPIQGEALILQETIETFVLRALDHDLKLLSDSDAHSLEVIECEKEHRVQLDFSHDDVTARFNFTYKPDRVDRIDGRLRMVDYKTGNDLTVFSLLDDLFVAPTGNKKRRKAILQLMLYCNAWWLEHPDDDVIEPVIYKLRNMDEAGVSHGKEPYVFDARSEVNLDFRCRMGDVIAGLLDMSGDFSQAEPGSKCCQYCRFTDFCRR